jgi:hypothetical protein
VDEIRHPYPEVIYMSRNNDQALLDEAFDELEQLAPDRVTRAIRWLRSPKSRWVRLPIGGLLIVASFFWFLPVLGIELLPIGLLLVAQDIPLLKRPVARMMLWLERKWVEHRQRSQRNKRAKSSSR